MEFDHEICYLLMQVSVTLTALKLKQIVMEMYEQMTKFDYNQQNTVKRKEHY